MDERIDGWMKGFIDGWIDKWINGKMMTEGRMDIEKNEWMDGWMREEADRQMVS